MSADEREQHDALLLSEERLQGLSANERQSYLERLHIHTLVGCDLILAVLDTPLDAEQIAQMQSVYQSLSCRQEKLLELLEQG
ncbi:MAG TPA: hypothetical protein VJ761_17780 [Ktedonobacteraceae bacterium]|nr:hypothetical protein [Ktedonobacteraceae bacterium]